MAERYLDWIASPMDSSNYLLKTLYPSGLNFSPGEEVVVESFGKDEKPRVPDTAPGAVRSVEPMAGLPYKVAALTFDICERTKELSGYDGRIIDILRNLGVSPTLFICGKWMRSHRDKAKQLILDEIFEIGSHSWDHCNFVRADEAHMSFQIDATTAIFEELKAEIVADIVQADGFAP